MCGLCAPTAARPLRPGGSRRATGARPPTPPAPPKPTGRRRRHALLDMRPILKLQGAAQQRPTMGCAPRVPDPGRPACRGQWLATDSSGRRQALLKAHCPVSLELGGAGLDIEPADSHAHRRAVRHRTAGPAPPANSTPLVAVVIELVPSPAGPYRAGVARATRGEARAAALPRFVLAACVWFLGRCVRPPRASLTS
jgi:hypothetical protein